MRLILQAGLWLLAVAALFGSTAQAAPVVITENGAVVENLTTSEAIIVQANDVTLRNVTAHRLWHQRPYQGLIVTDSVFVGDDPTDYIGAVVQPNTLIERTEIKGHKDGLYIETGGKVTVRDTLIDITSDVADNHSDGVTLPFDSNFNGTADFLFEAVVVWAEGKTASFNQQAKPVTVVNSRWSGTVYAAEGSSYQGWAQNPDAFRLYGRPVPWQVPWSTFDAVVDRNVRPLSEAPPIPEPTAMTVLALVGLAMIRPKI